MSPGLLESQVKISINSSVSIFTGSVFTLSSCKEEDSKTNKPISHHDIHLKKKTKGRGYLLHQRNCDSQNSQGAKVSNSVLILVDGP